MVLGKGKKGDNKYKGTLTNNLLTPLYHIHSVFQPLLAATGQALKH